MSTISYSVNLATGTPPAAGSSSGIYVRLCGEQGESPEFRPGNLSRDSMCSCAIQCEDLGELKSLRIRSDAIGHTPGWYARYITVTNSSSGKVWLASMEHWLDETRSNISVINLFPLSAEEARRPILTYRMKTRTGSDGTNSPIDVQLIGSLGQSHPYRLDLSEKDEFEPGEHNTFKLAWPDLGNIQQVIFYNRGNDSLTLESVSITLAVSGLKWRGSGGVIGTQSDGPTAFSVTPDTQQVPIPSRPSARPTPSRPSARPAPSRPSARPAPSRPSARPAPSRPSARPTPSRPSARPAPSRPSARPAPSRPSARPAPSRPSARPAPSRPSARPAPSRPSARPTPSRPSARPAPSRPSARPAVPSRPGLRLPPDSHQHYHVEVRTGSFPNAGTDANVWFRLLGTSSDSEWLLLDNSKNNFEAGAIDLFNVHAGQYLGQLRGIVLRQDGSGSCPGWYVNEVICTDMVEGTSTYFPCFCWLAADEDDGLTQRTFFPTVRPSEVPLPANYADISMVYDVTVVTSNYDTAGTDADVFLQLVGTNGRASRLFHLNHPGRNDFESGSTCRFTVVAETDLVDVARILIGHRNNGACPSWHLDSVTLVNRQTRRVSRFPCRRWLASDEDDHKIERVLYPTEVPDGVENPSAYRMLAREYDMQVKTGDRQGAGTNANVYVTLTGLYGRSERRLLDSPFLDDCERGMYDYHPLVLQGDIGSLFSILVEHDNMNVSPGWFLDRIDIKECFQNRYSYRFPCGRWLAVDEDDGKISRELRTTATLFTFSVTTGSYSGAGTDANVFVRLVGSQGVSSFYELDIPTYNDFEQDDCDQYKVYVQEDIGELQYVDIRQNGRNPASDWYLNWIHVHDSRDGSVTPFVFNSWVYSGRIYRISPGIVCTVSVKTGGSNYAGTNSNVFLTLHGTNGSTERVELDGPDDDFERNAINHFVVGFRRHPGELQRITVYKDDSGTGPDWHLKWIEIIDQSTSRMKHFDFDGLLSADHRTVTLSPR